MTNSLKLIDESTEADLVVRPLLGDYHFTIYSDTSSIYLKEKQIDELIEYLTKLKEN